MNDPITVGRALVATAQASLRTPADRDEPSSGLRAVHARFVTHG